MLVTSFSSPKRGDPCGSASPSSAIRDKQWRELRAENDRLENQLQNLRLSYRSTEGNSPSSQEFAHNRFVLESYLRDLNLEVEVLDREIVKRRNSQTKVLEEQSERELELAELLKEEKILSARRQAKLEQRKEELKMETKRQLASMNSQKRLIESDIQALTGAITRMKQLRGDAAFECRAEGNASPEKKQQLLGRLEQVRSEVAALDIKCRTLQDFVAVRSPERYAAIMNERRWGLQNAPEC
jgi:hypothetical protein